MITYLHGLHFVEEHGFGGEFEAKVTASLGEFYLSFNPDKERLWLAEKKGQVIGSAGIVEISQLQGTPSLVY
jgi:hypothetical protein